MKNKLLFLFTNITKHKKTCAFGMGWLSILAFAPRFWIVFAFLSFSYLLYLLVSTQDKKNLFKIGYAFGFAHFAFGFSWIGNALLIDAKQFGWLYPITLMAAGAFFGLFFAIPAVCTYFAKTKWQKWLAFSAVFVLFEWIRSFIFTGFPWNLTGYTLAFSDELIQSASVGGTYLLSLIAVMTYSVFGVLNKKTFFPVCVAVALTWGVMFCGGYWRIKNANHESSDVLVRLVQPSIPQVMKWDREVREQNFIEYLALSNEDVGRVPDLIVWGETASPFVLDREEYYREMLKPILKKGSYLVTGMVSYKEKTDRFVPYNSMVVFDKNSNPVGYYHKTHLVPFGEYIPLREYLPDFIKPVANAIGEFGRGNGPEVMRFEGLPSFGGIVCYEAIFPAKVVDKNNRPDFLINVTNDGWYGDSSGPYQHWVATKLRAVEEGVQIVRVANNGISGLINALGQEKGRLELNEKKILDVILEKAQQKTTIYSKTGNLIIISFCLILLFFCFITFRYKIRYFYKERQ